MYRAFLAPFLVASTSLGAGDDKPQLTAAEALDIAAFIDADEALRALPRRCLEPASFAVPEHFEGGPDDHRKAKYGPFPEANERY